MPDCSLFHRKSLLILITQKNFTSLNWYSLRRYFCIRGFAGKDVQLKCFDSGNNRSSHHNSNLLKIHQTEMRLYIVWVKNDYFLSYIQIDDRLIYPRKLHNTLLCRSHIKVTLKMEYAYFGFSLRDWRCWLVTIRPASLK